MIRSMAVASSVLLATCTFAGAQNLTGRSVDPRAGTLNERNITGTGATVPNPGVSQGNGTTSLDIGTQRRDTEIQNSICRGC